MGIVKLAYIFELVASLTHCDSDVLKLNLLTMKTLLLSITLSIIAATSFGQVNFEHTYHIDRQAFYTINIGNDNYKYVIVDYDNDKFSLYNLDHSPFMINVPTVTSLDSGAYEVVYITTDLFDCDSSHIEFALMRPSGMPSNFYVYRTDGTLIWEKDSVKGVYCFGCANGTIDQRPIVNTPTGAKLTLYDLTTMHDYHVYSLCGTLPTMVNRVSQDGNFVEMYPNPSSDMISFKVNPPNNNDDYELVIFNAAMQMIKREKINGARAIDVKGLSSGAYFYSLKTTDKVSQTGKFIITQ